MANNKTSRRYGPEYLRGEIARLEARHREIVESLEHFRTHHPAMYEGIKRTADHFADRIEAARRALEPQTEPKHWHVRGESEEGSPGEDCHFALGIDPDGTGYIAVTLQYAADEARLSLSGEQIEALRRMLNRETD